jgi:anti-sigma regulatory factor (Ser/Thr protein kinase)
MTWTTDNPAATEDQFRHEAWFVDGDDEFVDVARPFIDDGLDDDQAILVALPSKKAGLLRRALGSSSSRVEWAEMERLGRNPGRIISAWSRFVDASNRAGRPCRGIGEAVWRGRSDQELVECHHHEALLNLAFDEGTPWRLACPYDTSTLDRRDIELAPQTHPTVRDDAAVQTSGRYAAAELAREGLRAPLPPRPVTAETRPFDTDSLSDVRAVARDHALRAGLRPERIDDLVLAVGEAVANSVQYAHGDAEFWIWSTRHVVTCDVHDAGLITDPLIGRRPPEPSDRNGRGLWLIHEVSDLVQIRSTDESGTTVRIHFAVD